MRFNTHFNLQGKHAFLSPSSPSWINYDDEHLDRRLITYEAARRGTELHALAHQLILLKVKLPMTDATLNRYVNDAIGFGMNPEQMLYYSDNCFGTADALSFKNNVLRIHDLKTGILEAKVEQLEVYAALFCLEYHVSPMDIEINLRFYQNDAVLEFDTDVTAVMHIMSQIIHMDTLINKIRSEALA